MNETALQRKYYADTAARYEEMHVEEQDEHFFALGFLAASVEYLKIQSILDIGSGTGRAIRYIKRRCPGIRIVGVEPVPELREQAYKLGVAHDEIVDGDALKLVYKDGAFDLVCAFGVLHHVKTPNVAIAEMLRVAAKAIFISDANNFGQGSYVPRSIKQLINAFGLWGVANLIKTRGKGYIYTEGDGVSYSYSVFNNYDQIKKSCDIHLFNTIGDGKHAYKDASHVALLAVMRDRKQGA